jgi:hypothetical protein
MATFAEQMLAKYETLLQTSAGLDTVSVDGDIFFLKLSGGRFTCLSSPAARAGAAARVLWQRNGSRLRRCRGLLLAPDTV